MPNNKLSTPIKATIVAALPTTASAKPQKQSLANFDDLPDSAFARVATLSKIVPFSIPTIWRKSRNGTFPAPVKLSAGITAWNIGAVRVWLATQATV
jgi:prophage regulatory protein